MLGDFKVTERAARAARIIHVSGKPGEGYRLYRGCSRVDSTQSAETLLANLLAVVNLAVIDDCPHFAVHAAAVANGEGVVAIPADSGGGKSTLAAAAVMAGLTYLSDEALVVDDQSRVIPYPKPIALSPWSCEVLGLPSRDGESLFTPTDLGGTVFGGLGRLTDIVVPERAAGELKLEPRPQADAVAQLIRLSFNHYKHPARAFHLSTELARQVRVWSLRYDDPREAAEALAHRLHA